MDEKSCRVLFNHVPEELHEKVEDLYNNCQNIAIALLLKTREDAEAVLSVRTDIYGEQTPDSLLEWATDLRKQILAGRRGVLKALVKAKFPDMKGDTDYIKQVLGKRRYPTAEETGIWAAVDALCKEAIRTKDINILFPENAAKAILAKGVFYHNEPLNVDENFILEVLKEERVRIALLFTQTDICREKDNST